MERKVISVFFLMFVVIVIVIVVVIYSSIFLLSYYFKLSNMIEFFEDEFIKMVRIFYKI